MTSFDDIDKMAIQTICETYEEGAILMDQYLNAKILQRKTSPVGWFTDFHVDSNCTCLSVKNGDVGNADARVKDMKRGIGFLLWIEDGMLSCLEAFTYEENFPEHIEVISIANN